MRIEERIINGRNNAIVLGLSVSDPLSDVAVDVVPTRCQVLVGATLLDSAVNPEYFDFTIANLVKIKAGSAGLTAGHYSAKLYIFDDAHPLGLEWVEFIVDVVD